MTSSTEPLDTPDRRDDHVAIVGVGLRLPGGVNSLSGLAKALAEEVDLVGEIPADRFDKNRFVSASGSSPGKSYTAAGGFVDDIAGFDAEHFGISPKEASRMDPQHRLLLECAAEGLDDAGLDPARLAGTDTAVFIGISTRDYGDLQMKRPRAVNAYSMAGAAASNAANRLSHSFDLRGQSVALDTACSSSLTAVHNACETLRSGRSALALAGGVTVLLNPMGFIGGSQASMLSPTGRCHPFSALADGFVRSEGAGVFVLKPLRAAVADGDRIHAVIMGTAANCDGHTPGLALPSATAQEALLREVYEAAGVEPAELAYLEAHGTGTQAGDPVECAALGAALGRHRVSDPIPVGSVKSNLGHLEAAAGVAGLCKAIVVMRERRIPRTLHSEPVNPTIDFAGLGLEPVLRARPLTVSGRRCVVGVNSFGFGGANAHVILGAPAPAPVPQPAPAPPSGSERLRPLVLSARTERAVAQAAQELADHLSRSGDAFVDVAFSTCRLRARHHHGLAVLATGADEAAARLRSLAGGESVDHGSTGTRAATGTVGFVFSGNGAPWPGMAAELLGANEAFTAEVDALDAVLRPRLGWSVRAELTAPKDAARWERADVVQPLLFTVQVGLVAALKAAGISPAAVSGHSVGEVAAAYCAGVLDRDEACRVIVERSHAQALTHGQGGMAAVGLGEEEALRRLREAGLADRIVVAGVNSDRDVTVSGDGEALAAWGTELRQAGVFHRPLSMPYAFHSPAMDGTRSFLADRLRGLAPGKPRIPVFSTVTGGALPSASAMNDQYWWRNIREPVRFRDAITDMIDTHEVDILLEIGPHPILGGYLRRITAGRHGVEVLATLSRTASGPTAVEDTAARLLAAGAVFDHETYFPDGARVVDLPAYPWQREIHWNGDADWWLESGGEDLPTEAPHALLGRREQSSDPQWQADLEPGTHPWLADHKVDAAVVMPVAGFLDMVLSAAGRVWDGPVEALNVVVQAPLALPFADPSARTSVQTRIRPDDGRVTIAARSARQEGWTEHVRGRVRRLTRPQPTAPVTEEMRTRLPLRAGAEEHYALCTKLGLNYGPVFRSVRRVHAGGDEVLADHRLGEDLSVGEHLAHPAVLDGALQSAVHLLGEEAAPYLPVSVESVRSWQPLPADGTIRLLSRTQPAMIGTELLLDVTLTTPQGAVALELRGVRMRRFVGGPGTAVPRMREELRSATLPGRALPPAPPLDPRAVATRASEALAVLGSRRRSRRHDRFRPRSLEMIAHFTASAIRSLAPTDTPFTLDDLEAAGAHPKHRRLLTALLEQAAGHGVIARRDENTWTHARHPRPEELFTTAVLDFPGDTMQLQTYAVCGRHLADVLTGRRDPMDLLFSEADTLAARLYDTAGVLRHHNQVAAVVLEAVLADRPRDRPLRILEVGAGTGATTRCLLPVLPADRTEYTYTDISPAFLTTAQRRFPENFLTFRTLDLDADPVDQGFTPASYDLVIAGHALHTAKDLSTTLARVSTLLVPGGHLLAMESTDADHFVSVFGLLDSFWSATDTELRPRGPIPSREQWTTLLADNGFADITHHGDGEGPDRHDTTVILATRARVHPATGPQPVPAPESIRPQLIVTLDDHGDHTRRLAHELIGQAAGAARHVDAEQAARVWEDTAREQDSPVDIVVLIDADRSEDAPPDLVTDQAVRHCALLRDIARVTARHARALPHRLWLVVHTARALPGALPPAPGAGAVAWGAARSLANEAPELDIRRVALDWPDPNEPDSATALARVLRAEFTTPTAEDEVLLARHTRAVPRLRPARPAVEHTTGPAVLNCTHRGHRYRLHWQQQVIPDPGPDEITIEVRASALNYRDIMVATAQVPPWHHVPDQRPGLIPLGFESAGTVVAIGGRVHDLAIGDRVCAPGHYALATHAVARADRAIRLPDDMTFAEAATLPVAFITVQHCLQRLAKPQPGETMLVHGAAGGVGLAAWQYARAHGIKVIATAGTPAKRDLLRTLGIEHVLNSRGLDFAEEITDITGGRGVDVVLNCLAGEAATRSLGLLAQHGRFVELGKRDIIADQSLPLGAFSADLAYFGADISAMVGTPSPVMDRHRDTISRLVHEGTYRPLPHRVYPAAEIADAFACLQHSRHIGKVVVTFDDPVPARPAPPSIGLRPEATYLITGGLNGFGAATARHLARRGARRLELVSRRGAQAPEAPGLLADLRAQGVHVTAHAADVTDTAAMTELFKTIDAGGHPLAGVIHAAMVLDDDDLVNLSTDRLRRVLAPKLTGVHNLDRLTRSLPLDFFIAYSSGAATVGNFKQAPYIGGNLALDTLIRDRRRDGLPGLSIQWGVINDSGYALRTEITDQLLGLGLGGLGTQSALTTLDTVMFDPDADVVAVVNFDWSRLAHSIPRLTAPRTAHLLDTTPGTPGGTEHHTDLAHLPEDEAREIIVRRLAHLLARIMQTTPDKVDRTRRLDLVGVDSLMAAELGTNILNDFGCRLASMDISGAAHLDALARLVHDRIPATRPTTGPDATTG
ncbi:SDR family NAD(P)-dependent oxidoreductase (plasmid) [Streptomyces sp. BI20]|uniref:SDR family NAD(P)-dependent oxidoreductase n=1 Tax=Streptomyces sp. BI20 TaxID=3403460 RepID=UPI003C7473B9